MNKSKRSIIEVQGTSVSILSKSGQDYISLTDMIRAKDGDFFIADWLRNRNTVEFLGIWESVFNPAFNYGEFATIKSQVGLNSYKISVKDWAEKTNAKSLNSVLIRQGLPQPERLFKLNEIAITQMRTLLTDNNIKRLK